MIPFGSVDVNVALRMSAVKAPSNSVRLTNSSNVTSELFTLPNNASLTDAPTGTHGRLVEINSVELVTVNVNEPVRLVPLWTNTILMSASYAQLGFATLSV